jgi:Flp pilus assembly secretin CpaC
MEQLCWSMVIVAGLLCTGLPAQATDHKAEASAQQGTEPVIVTVDRARLLRIPESASTIIVGNPSIADATIKVDRTLVLTGRSFGVTNLIILGLDGETIIDRTFVVRGHETNTVRVYRRANRETLACAPVCEPTLTIGDNAESFSFAYEQIRERNSLSDQQ